MHLDRSSPEPVKVRRHVPELGSIIALQIDNGTDAHRALRGAVQPQGLSVQDVDEGCLDIQTDAEAQVEVEALQGRVK